MNRKQTLRKPQADPKYTLNWLIPEWNLGERLPQGDVICYALKCLVLYTYLYIYNQKKISFPQLQYGWRTDDCSKTSSIVNMHVHVNCFI